MLAVRCVTKRFAFWCPLLIYWRFIYQYGSFLQISSSSYIYSLAINNGLYPNFSRKYHFTTKFGLAEY